MGCRSWLTASTVVLAVSSPLWAYDAPLQPAAIRDAYFLGQRSDGARETFLAAYVKRFPLPEKGPYVSEIELLTPYAQVVSVSAQHTVGYSAQQAAEDYKNRGDLIQVRVRIELTPTYGAIAPKEKNRGGIPLRTEDFWKSFQITLRQSNGSIGPLRTRSEPIYLESGALAGTQVWLSYDTKDVASAKTTVEVEPPEGGKVRAKFDLDRLR